MTFISRRDLLKRAAVVGGAAAVSRSAEATRSAEAFALHTHSAEAFAIPREPLENLTAAEADVLEAIVARLIPTDANGPGATEARAAHYIDRALGGALAASRPAYTAGLAALDRYARSSRGKPFAELSATDQDSVLIDVETGAADRASPAARPHSSRWCSLTRCRARSAIRTTAATRTSSAGI